MLYVLLELLDIRIKVTIRNSCLQAEQQDWIPERCHQITEKKERERERFCIGESRDLRRTKFDFSAFGDRYAVDFPESRWQTGMFSRLSLRSRIYAYVNLCFELRLLSCLVLSCPVLSCPVLSNWILSLLPFVMLFDRVVTIARHIRGVFGEAGPS